ncbi:uncharacterized protein LOC129601606 [Paramacrobiotus metropolitanus]|uniref:uncharacterized protein LOC129601606 n=1 Tax=Paramacrobiotus metropolitanus TaxID=2943436 RepID=UPI002445FD28|nr:uncharacterized protein LOC129601606 [Paramacrobiotus metropolitanus]
MALAMGFVLAVMVGVGSSLAFPYARPLPVPPPFPYNRPLPVPPSPPSPFNRPLIPPTGWMGGYPGPGGFMQGPLATGGLSVQKEADETVQKAVDAVADQIKKATGSTDNRFIAVEYRTGVVAGLNYFVKVRWGAKNLDRYYHVAIFQDLKGNFTLTNVKDASQHSPIMMM